MILVLDDKLWGNTSFGSMGTTSPEDIQVGKKALQYFHNRAIGYEEYPFVSVDELAKYYTKDPEILYDGLGFAINSIGSFLTDSKVETAMYAIADKGKGKIPSNMSVFFSKIGQVASNPSVVDSIPYVSVAALSDIGEGLEYLGTSTVSSLKQANFLWSYGPWIALGLGALFIGIYAKGLGKGHGSLGLGAIKK